MEVIPTTSVANLPIGYEVIIKRKKGYDIPEPPQAIDSTFLKNVAMPGDDLYE